MILKGHTFASQRKVAHWVLKKEAATNLKPECDLFGHLFVTSQTRQIKHNDVFG